MTDKKSEMLALLKLISYAKSEAERLNLPEVNRLLELPGLSLLLSYTNIDLEKYKNIPNSKIANKIAEQIGK